MIGPDGRMTAEGFEGLTQEEANERVIDWLKQHDQLEKRESYRHSVAHVRALPLADRAARLARSGGARWTSSACRRSRRSRRTGSPTTRRASTGSRSSHSRTRPTGASPGSSGGAIRSRSGRVLTATRRAPGRRRRRARSAALASSNARPMFSTPGSPPPSGRSRPSAGRSRHPSSRGTTRATSTSRPARSSASGRTG